MLEKLGTNQVLGEHVRESGQSVRTSLSCLIDLLKQCNVLWQTLNWWCE